MAQQTKLEIRSAIKKRKPTYRRRQSNQFAKVAKKDSWRRPKGMGNKSRRNRRGHIGMLQVGYGSPKEIKGTNRDGLFEVIVSNIADLEKVQKSTQIAILSRTLGMKKKLDVLKVAKKNNILIGNVKDISTTIKEIESKFEEKKGSKKVEPKEKDATKSSKSTPKKGENKEKLDTKSEVESKKNESTSKKPQSGDNLQAQQNVNKKTTTTTTTTKKVSASSSNSKSETKEVSKK